MAYATSGLLAKAGISGIMTSGASKTTGISNTANAGIPQSGYQFASFSSIALGSTPVSTSITNIKPPNGYPLSNLQIALTVTDTTGSTAPSGVNSIESAIQQIQIVGTSGKPLAVFNGSFGELTRWQQLLNTNQSYIVAPTPSDTTTGTSYAKTWLISFNHLVIDPSEYPLTVSMLPNTLASRATTLNAMTSAITSLTVSADFVPVTGYVKTLFRTKQISDASTGYFDLGQFIDNAIISTFAADFGADTNLNAVNTFYLASQNNTLLPYTSYNAIVTAQDNLPANSGGAANHISGFFPYQTLYKAAINGGLNIKLLNNISSAPSGGGQANTINLYEGEQYQ